MRASRFATLVVSFALLSAGLLRSYGQAARRLYRSPSLSDRSIAFRYADDVWTVPVEGGVARRLTSTGNVVEGPFFSPDGTMVAYSAHKQGATDVYVVPASGGVPRRITFHPGGNFVIGWTPDGKSVLYTSMQESVRTYFQIYTMPVDGSGLPHRLPLPSAADGSMSPDGGSIAYNPWLQWQAVSWKRYRGGQTQPVWIVNLKTLDLVKVPRENSNDTHPVWLGDAVYFLSDRNGPVTLFRYDTKTREVKQVVENHGLDLKTLGGRGDRLVYEQFGAIHVMDAAGSRDREVEIAADGDLPRLASHIERLNPHEIQNAHASPTGARAVVEAHGDIFTIPAEHGDTRNLTDSSNAAEREPAWSPDGKMVAYFSDADGEYKLYLKDQNGVKPPKVIALSASPTYYYSPVWSPDSKKVVFSDKRLNLWYVDVDAGKPVHVETNLVEGFGPQNFSASFSPDSKWILYTRHLPNFENAAFLFTLAAGKSTQITDGMSDVQSPVFDRSGKYVFFVASTDAGPARDGFGLNSLNRTASANAYVAVLSKDEISPIPPLSDDEAKPKSDDEKKSDSSQADKQKDRKEDKAASQGKATEPAPETKIDLDGIQSRILPLPVPPRNYVQVQAAGPGEILLSEAGPAPNPSSEEDQSLRAVWKFTLKERKTIDVLNGLGSFEVTLDGKKALYRKGDGWFMAELGEMNPGAADGTPGKPLHTDSMVAHIDPRAEWKQIYDETWRIEREFFYDPGYHGLNLARIAEKYRPYELGLSARSDLTYLQQEMLGEMTVGHMFVEGPHTPEDGPKPGLLGADFEIDRGRYRIRHIIAGGNWNPTLYSPLTQPGVNAHAGEYLLAVNGHPLTAAENIFAAFDGLAGKQTQVTLASTADGANARDVTVVPVDSEREARMQEWIEGNIRRADQLSNHQVAYVYLPNTAGAGFNSFNRYFFAQVEKKAVVVDDRFNQGGDIADYVIDVLKRTPMINYESREGRRVTEPTGAIFGPKAMLINQNAGSGGDAMPWLFRQAKLGPLVGTTTWGGLVGIGGYPVLLDGGSVTAPRTALYGLTGKFDIENIGVPPDIAVEDTPKAVAEGHDPQLERAIEVVMEELRKHPPQQFSVPPYPNYHKADGLGER